MPTRLVILAVGSRGDVQPFVALGRGLQAAGYQVRLATHAGFEAFVRGYGLDFAPLEGNPQAIVAAGEGKDWMASGRNPLGFVRGFRAIMREIIERAMHDGLAACQGAEALVAGGPAFYGGYPLAQKLGLPFFQAYLQPLHPTRAFPSALFPTPFHGGGLYNLASAYLAGLGFWLVMRPAVNRAMREVLDLPPTPLMGPWRGLEQRHSPVFYGFSPAVLPKPADWGDWVHVTGYWFLDHPEWSPPAELADFLAAGPPPVYVGFGSMAGDDPAALTELIVAALRQAGQRGVLASGWAGLAQADLPADILRVDDVPHDRLFPHMAAVVHHGGAGTTAAGLRAGKPTATVPFFADQPFWADRVHALGAGPAPLDRKRLTADALAAAIRTAVTDPAMGERAAALGERIRAEDGIGRAVDHLRALLPP